MNVIKLKRENNALDIALMVDSATKAESQEYDESAIVDALIREAGCDKPLAKEVAGIVTERLMSANLTQVSTSLIRSMVNNVLLEKGLNKELKNKNIKDPMLKYPFKILLEKVDSVISVLEA